MVKKYLISEIEAPKSSFGLWLLILGKVAAVAVQPGRNSAALSWMATICSALILFLSGLFDQHQNQAVQMSCVFV